MMFEYINNNDITMVAMPFQIVSHFLYNNSVMSVVYVCVSTVLEQRYV